ncbi:hypothetical protein BJI67_10770 [Acidihalobacter aeolianus]|uniref:Uncharacterized protein n=1 Tax=Acidihalobacter aeolianus TaxID=2792603 RepID=A0A1D8K943_9GAMM|nr:type I polyketide synthase [Acidihalobacter aeolianus]AOV17477.1 hypothetical protein BJI67_10770 [Acidihalobacter aeolianus]
MKDTRIAIVGYSTRLPQTSDARFWADLLAERSLITQVAADRWAHGAYHHPERGHPGTSVTFSAGSLGDVSGFDAGFFRISPREAAAMDPQQRLLLEMSWEALSHAGLKPAELRSRRCGVFIGLASTDYAYRVADDLAVIGPNSATGSTASIAANRLSYFYDWRGPSLVVDTACSSGLVAFHQACRSLLAGESDVAVTGAISLHLHPYGFVIFSKASMLSASGKSRPFQAGADGYVRSEGGGVFVLKPYETARRDGDRILAVVARSGINADGYKSGLTVPRVDAQAALLREIYEAAGIDPNEVDYLEAHGTGTAVGDPIEVEAIGQALGQARREGHPLPIGSVKSNLGHLETASAVPGLLKAIHALRERAVPPTIGIAELNPRLPLDRYGLEVVTRTRPLRSRGQLTIGVNSFGFGGANAHVILQSPPAQRRRVRSAPPAEPATAQRPLMLTAASPSALRQFARDLHGAIAAQKPAQWEASLYQLNFRREWLAQRALLWVSSRGDLLDKLDAFAERGVHAQTGESLADWRTPDSTPGGPVWVFSGNGCQWEGMGRELLDDPTFAASVDEIDATFAPLAGYRLRDDLLGLLGEHRYALTQFAQPALFALQVGQAAMLRAHGFEPTAVIGHSVGEVAAAWACGALSLADATRVVFYRSHEQERARGLGQMTAVAAAAEDAAEWIAELRLDAQLCVAAHNSPRGCTVAGDTEALTRLETFLRGRGVACKRLPLDYPFHGPHMDALREPLQAHLAAIEPRASTIPFFSTVTGEMLSGEQLDADYWWHNVRAPVSFTAAFAASAEYGSLFVELGGHPVLRSYMQDILAHHGRSGRPIETLRRDQSAQREALRAAAGELWIAGLPAQWERHYPQALPFVDLPHYPWEHERHWHEISAESAGLLHRHPAHPLLGHPVAGHPGAWEQRVDTASFPWLADHCVGDGAIFPGAGYVELMLAAATQDPERDPATGLRVEGLEILAPLLLEENAAKIVRTRLSDEGSVEVQARPLLGDAWTLHARGRISEYTGPGDAPHAPPEGGGDGFDFAAEQHYAIADAAGLHYGPAFRTVASGRCDGDRLWAKLTTSEALPVQGFCVQPALLDGAFQLFIDRLVLDGTAERGWGFVPVRVERLTWHAGTGTPVAASARLLRRSPQSFLAEVQLLDAEGRVCASCSGVRMRRLRLQRHDTERVRSFATLLQPLPRPEAPAAFAADDLIRHAGPALTDNEACRLYAEEYAPLLAAYLEDLGGNVESGMDAVDADALWQTLLQDYPEFLDWTLAAGRRRLAAQGLGEAAGNAGDMLAGGYRRLLALPVRSLSGALATAVLERLAVLPGSGRLDVLELAEGQPELLPRLAGHVDAAGPHLGLQHADPAPVEPCSGCGWSTFDLARPPAHLPPLDLVWIRQDLRDTEARRGAFAFAAERLRPGGWLLVSGLEPEFWWHELGIPAVSASLDECLAELTALDLEIGETQRLDAGGHWLALARRGTAVADQPSAADWLLTGTGGNLAPLAAALRERQQAVHMPKSAPPTRGGEALDAVRWQHASRNLLFHVPAQPGPAAGEQPAQGLLATCEALRRTGLWALRQHPAPHLTLLLPGALADGDAGSALLARGVAAFARTLQNEWPDLELRILDADPAAESVRNALLDELLHPDAEREILIDAAGTRHVARVVERRPQPDIAQPDPVHRLDFSTPGQLRHLSWRERSAAAPGPGEVEVAVRATGLNFRDVMYTLGLLSDEALENGFSGPTLGLEFAGVLTAVGEGVSGWSVGDRVLGFAAASFSDRLVTSATSIAPLPADLSFVQGATVPTVFFTAWYALHEQARLRAGERVLIHGGAGGVGIAAIQIAQQAGAEVLATAGSPAKRDFLRLLGVQHVYDSRSLAFADEILRDTDGEGVDIVLNSLAGEAMRRSLHLLKPFGRFLDLGKRDFYADTPLGLRPMRNNLSYFGIDADQMMAVRPALTQDIFKACLAGFADGSLSPLPATVFSTHGVVDAFRHMQHSRQIGKIVVDMGGPFLPRAADTAPAPARLELDRDGVYLITGGTAGFGLQSALRLAERGARRLLLASRSGNPDEAGAATLEALRQQGVELRCVRCDIADGAQVHALFAEAAEMGTLRGLVHAAAVIDDALAENLDEARLRSVLAPKVDGAWHLHRLSRGQALDFFVVYSSIANLLGNVGQAAYLAANGWMEALVRLRRAQGLPGTAVQFGPIADAGFLTRNEQTRSALEKRIGGAALSATAALDALEAALLGDEPVVAAADLHWGAIRRYLPLAETPQYAELDAQDADPTGGIDTTDLRAHLAELGEDEAADTLGGWIIHEVAQILRLAPEKIDRQKKLTEMGFDSLMGMELALALEERLGFKVPTFVLSEEPTVQKLAQRLLRELLQEESAHDTARGDERHLSALAEQHGVGAEEYSAVVGFREG